MSKTKTQTSLFQKLIFGLNFLVAILMLGAYLGTHISPQSFSYLALLGLAYPYLLWTIMIFTVFWLIKNKKYMVFNVLIFLLGWNHFSNFYVFNTSTSVHSADAIQVMSYNVRIFNYYDSKNRIDTRDNIFNFLTKSQPDVICFQEFYHENGSQNFKTKDTLVSFLNAKHNHERYTHEMLGEKYFGLATFTKFPIVGKGEIAFDNDDNNYCIFTDIKKNRDTLRVFNAHLGSIRLQDSDYAFFGDLETGKIYQREVKEQKIVGRLLSAFEKRAAQIKLVMEKVVKSPYPVILCGDFNDTPVSYCYRQVSRHLEDSFVESGNGVGATYVGKIPSNRIDYIFHSKGLKASEFTVHDFEFSDHKPVSCFIEKNHD
ncbi:MAG: endonuclease/exonuclease/phosphatase family protein [Putridiphycobacter sp.]